MNIHFLTKRTKRKSSLLHLKIKFSFLIIMVTFFQLKAEPGLAQKSKITLDTKDTPIIEVMGEIEQITDYRFFYSQEELDLTKPIDINAKNSALTEVLKEIFAPVGISYKIIGKQVILKEAPPLSASRPEADVPVAQKQEVQVRGRVLDDTGEPLPGATVLEKGTVNGTQTDMDGQFTLTASGPKSILVFSYIGFESQEVSINNRQTINITLLESTEGLNEIVVVGYGTKRSSELVSAISQVSAEDLKVTERPVTSVQSALLGSVAGLNGAYGNGRPGSTPGFSIRGTSTLNSTSILVIIDGFEGSLSDVNPQDIESVSILKDAAAVSVYGARGANGVMLVTTKGTKRNEQISVDYRYNYSLQKPTALADMLNSSELMQFTNVAAGAGNEVYDQDALALAASGFYPETNWAEELYQSQSGQQSHNLSVTGGSEKTGYLINAGYLTQDGLVVGSDNFKRINLRVKVDTDITDWFSTGVNALISNRITESTPAIGADGILGLPFYPVKTEDGYWAEKGSPGAPNPIAEAASGSFSKNNRDATNIQIYAKVKPFKGLVFEERVSFIKNNENIRDWSNIYDYVSLDYTDPDSYTNPSSPNRIYTRGNPEARTLNLSSLTGYVLRTLSTLNYSLEKEDHSISALLGFQTEQGESEGFSAGRMNFLLDNVIDLQLGQTPNVNIQDVDPSKGGADPLGTTSYRGGNATTLSYFGRFNYGYKGKYMAEASFRVDGSSNFLANNRYGFFPAMAVGWNIAREEFMKDLSAIDQLKLRASYGQSGDDSGVGRRVVQLVNVDVTGYPFNGQIQPRLFLGSPASTDLQWETATTFNLGLDLSLLQGKFQMNAEYFITDRDDILDEVLTPIEFGFGNVPANLYSVKSWGYEFELMHRNQVGKVNYWVSGNFSDYDNEITDVAGRESINFAVGQSINDRLGYQTDGFFDSQEEIDAYTGPDGTSRINQSNMGGTFVGGYKYVDQLTVDTNGDGVPDQGDGVIDPDDRVILDRNSARNLNLGFSMGVGYKGFSLSARFYGTLDNNQWWASADAHEPFLNGSNVYTFQTDYWSQSNPDAIFPTPRGTGIQAYNSSVSHLIQNNEFIKLQNITLTYDFNKAFMERFSFIEGLNLVVSLENIGTIWSNSPAFEYGWDPELGVGTLDYPLPRIFSVGANVSF